MKTIHTIILSFIVLGLLGFVFAIPQVFAAYVSIPFAGGTITKFMTGGSGDCNVATGSCNGYEVHRYVCDNLSPSDVAKDCWDATADYVPGSKTVVSNSTLFLTSPAVECNQRVQLDVKNEDDVVIDYLIWTSPACPSSTSSTTSTVETEPTSSSSTSTTSSTSSGEVSGTSTSETSTSVSSSSSTTSGQVEGAEDEELPHGDFLPDTDM